MALSLDGTYRLTQCLDMKFNHTDGRHVFILITRKGKFVKAYFEWWLQSLGGKKNIFKSKGFLLLTNFYTGKKTTAQLSCVKVVNSTENAF